MPAVPVTVVSDVVCPFCFIGAVRLERAIATSGIEAQVRYAPFLLDPDTPRGGVDLRDRLRRKYGGDPAPMFARVEAMARASGIPLDFGRVTLGVRTVSAHVLLAHAADKGTQAALAMSLFRAYFLEGRNIGEDDELVAVAEAHGFTAAEARGLLQREDEEAAVRAEAQEAARAGVTGVPFFVFGSRLAVAGAQEEATLVSALQRAAQG